MRESSRRNDAAVAGSSPPHAGETELDVCERYVRFAKEAGGAGASFDPLVCFGQTCAGPITLPTNRLEAGQTAILDLGSPTCA